MAGDRLHPGDAGAGFGLRIVVRVGVDVVGPGAAAAIRYDLDTGDADAILRKEALIGRDQRVLIAFDDPELLGRRRRRAGAGSERARIDRAGGRWAELEALARRP